MEFLGRPIVIENNLSNRMSLRVDGYGRIEVTLDPFNYRNEQILPFLQANEAFLKKRLEAYARADLPNFEDGGKVRLLGKEYTVLRSTHECPFSVNGDVLTAPKTIAKFNSDDFFASILHPYVKELTNRYAQKYGLKVSSYVELKPWSTAWGKYYVKGNHIRYNTALVFVPLECIEYVVVHELCHVLHRNHGKAFWEQVQRIYPDCKQARALLKTYELDWLLDRSMLGKSVVYDMPVFY